MKILKKTTTGGLIDAHHHILFLDTENGYAEISSEDHVHPVQWQPPQQEALDEQGNVVQEASLGRFVIGPAPDGHTHEEEDYRDFKKGPTSEGDEEIIADVLTLYREAHSLEDESIEAGKEAFDFYSGVQWDRFGKSALEQAGRAALTINFTAKYINELLGYEIQNRTDIRYLPLEDGDQRVADMLNILVKQLCNQSYFDREKSKVFKDEVVPGRGVFNLYLDYTRDLRGEIRIERFPWDQFRAGPHEKEDLSDCEYIFKEKMFSLGKVKQLWGDKAEQLEGNYQNWVTPGTSSYVETDGDKYDNPHGRFPVSIGGVKLVDIAKKEVRVIECWRKVYMNVPVAVSTDHDFYYNVYGWKDADVAKIGTLPSFTVLKRPSFKIRITKIAGGVVLSDEVDANLPVDDFFVVPVYCNKHGSRFWGKVEDVKDAQREVNKRHSQAIDIGNRMAAYGWFYDATTFPDNELQKFRANSSTPGFVQEVQSLDRTPVKVEGVKFPTEIVQLMEIGSRHISELMNISIAPRGANTSAAALLQEQKIRLTGNEYLFDALSHALVRIGRLLIKLIQRVYSPERIFRILVSVNNRSPVQVGGKELSSYSEEEILHLLETADLDQYDVEIGESPNSPSSRLATYTILSDLSTKGLPVPPEAIILASDIPQDEKNKILEFIQMQQQSQADAAQATRKQEVEKTLIAQGLIPPNVAQEFGINGESQGGGMPQGLPPREDTYAQGGVAQTI